MSLTEAGPDITASAPPPGSVDLALPDGPAPVRTVVESDPAPAPAEHESGVSGWWHRRKEAAAHRESEDAEYRELAARITSGDVSEETLARLRELADPRRRDLARNAMRGYTEFVLADDVLSEAEEERWNEVAAALMPNAEPKQFGIETVTRLQVARINDGRLPVVPAGQSHIIEKRGECVHEEVPASLLKEVIDREFRGGSRGVSIPIVKGVRYRTGSFRGKSVVVGSHFEAADTGTLTVTSARVVFTGSRKTLEVPFAKLISIDAYNDGVRLHASNRQNAPLFRMSEGSAPVVAATINMAVQQVS